MEKQTALHTAIRRWLIERKAFYMHNPLGGHYEMHIRFLILDAIKFEIEAHLPEEFRDLDHLFETLDLIGHTATNKLLKQYSKPYAQYKKETIQAIMDAERLGFSQALEEIRRTGLHDVSPLPYRRTLPENEASQLWNTLKDTWGFKHGSWYPICGPPRPDNAIAFLAEMFYENMMPDKLPQILSRHGIKRVYQLHEGSPTGPLSGFPEYEMDVALIDPTYGKGDMPGIEKYWCTEKLDLLIYASHESSITVGGEWIVKAIKQAWPDWSKGIYEQFEIAHWHLGDYRPDEN